MSLLALSVNAIAVTQAYSQDNNKNEFVPQWAKKAVWYQIFPERFRNGDPSNDPKVVLPITKISNTTIDNM